MFGFRVAVAATFGLVAVKSGDVTLTVDGREVDGFVPDCKNQKSPIVLSLHAWGAGKDLQTEVDHLSNHIGNECPVILRPQGKEHAVKFFKSAGVGWSWNAGGCCPEGDAQHVDDIGFLGHLITEAATTFDVDGNTVFVVGISNGGMMANRLACSDQRIKALVAISGMLVNGSGEAGTEYFSCDRKLPVLHIHGLADPIVPFEGCNETVGAFACRSLYKMWKGNLAPLPHVDTYIMDWRRRNGISANVGQVGFMKGSVACTTWGESASNVTLCKIKGGGHSWPGSCMGKGKIPASWSGCSMDIDASEQAMAFFRRYVSSNTIFV